MSTTMADRILKRREPVLVIIDVNAPEMAVSAEIREQARSKLGYSPMRFTMSMTRQKLEEALHKAEVKPYTRESVNKYMKRQQLKATLTQTLKPAWIIWAFCIAALMVIYHVGAIGTPLIAPPLAVMIGSSLICLCERGWGWRGEGLKSYSGYIPDAALAVALRIKAHLPNAEFGVWSLSRDRRTLDPILDVVYGSQRASVAVWDEPEARLTTL